jgi:hypothetical protein
VSVVQRAPARRGLEISFTRECTTVTFQLLDQQAPRTVELLWRALPVTTEVHHCIAAGREVFSLLPPFSAVPPAENQALVPSAGDLWFIHLAHDFDVVPPGAAASADGIFDLAIWYGPDSWASTSDGAFLSGTHVGRLCSSPAALAAAGEGIWLRGSDTATFRRVELDAS